VFANIIYLRSKNYLTISIAILLSINILNIAYGSYCLYSGSSVNKSGTVAIIQPNITSREYYLKQNNRLFNKLVKNRLLELTRKAINGNPKLIIWPELAGEYILQNDEYLGYLHKTITSKGVDLLIGTSYIDYMEDRKEYNIAFLLRSNGTTTDPHRKMAIFPFVEAQRYSNGGKPTNLPSSYAFGNIGPMICLESTYPQIARKLVEAGATLLISISTDASFGNSMIPYIHSAQIVFRAIENNKYAIHAGNTGPSIVCDNKGRVLTYIPFGKTAIGFVSIL
jgi:apolipoprotein N-acyltransferase